MFVTVAGLALLGIYGGLSHENHRSKAHDVTTITKTDLTSATGARKRDESVVGEKTIQERPRPKLESGNQSTQPARRSVDPPLDPSLLKATQKQLREEWTAEMQKELWRQGQEITFQAKGTILFVQHVLAGDAFAFQFKEQFVDAHADTLRGIGFTKVVLYNGDSSWAWRL